MKAILASTRPNVVAPPAARPRTPSLRVAARPSAVRTRSVVNDIGKYLSEAASQIFHPQRNDTPWDISAQEFSGKIVHHEEDVRRLQALKAAVDSVVVEIESSMDQVPADDPAPGAAAADATSGAGEYVRSSIQRVFGNNATRDATEPAAWGSTTGYASQGRHRSQRELRQEYDRLQRFQSVVNRFLEEAKAEKK